MRFQVTATPPSNTTPASVATGSTNTADDVVVALIPNYSWNDYSYKTQFAVWSSRNGEAFQYVGELKILAREYAGKYDTASRLSEQFERLDPQKFCSLGQSLSFYQTAVERFGENKMEVLKALNDVCVSEIEDWWSSQPLFEKSLRRTNSAEMAQKYAIYILRGEYGVDKQMYINYARSSAGVMGGPDAFDVSFDATLKVPGRLNVVVGKNGCGKTSLLAGIAKWLSEPTRGYAQFDKRPRFSRIIIATFNPLDTAYRRAADDNTRFVGQQPMSERTLTMIKGLTSSTDESTWKAQLETAFPTAAKFRDDVGSLLQNGLTSMPVESHNHPEWLAFLNEVFEGDDNAQEAIKDGDESALSAGQKVLKHLYAALYFNLDSSSLVLIDEPENYLHPSLIAKFARSLNRLLDERGAFSIIATHSPVIVQETPSRFVTILQREGNVTLASRPNFETFGESIDNITQNLFETDFRSSHWKAVLRQLALDGYDMERASEMVSGELGLQLSLLARTYLSFHYKRVSRS